MTALPSVDWLIICIVEVVIECDIREGGGDEELALALLDVVEHLHDFYNSCQLNSLQICLQLS